MSNSWMSQSTQTQVRKFVDSVETLTSRKKAIASVVLFSMQFNIYTTAIYRTSPVESTVSKVIVKCFQIHRLYWSWLRYCHSRFTVHTFPKSFLSRRFFFHRMHKRMRIRQMGILIVNRITGACTVFLAFLCYKMGFVLRAKWNI